MGHIRERCVGSLAMFDLNKFDSKIESYSDRIMPFIMIGGAMIGAIIGFQENGIGGAILGGLLGAAIGWLALVIAAGLLEQAGQFAAACGIPILVILAVYLFWGVGKP